MAETTARGAALLAGLGAGFWRTIDELPPLPGALTVFEPRLTADERDTGYARWQQAIERAGIGSSRLQLQVRQVAGRMKCAKWHEWRKRESTETKGESIWQRGNATSNLQHCNLNLQHKHRRA